MHLEVLDEERLRKEAAEMAAHLNNNNQKYRKKCLPRIDGVDDADSEGEDDDDDDFEIKMIKSSLGSSWGSLRRPLSSSRHRAISHMEEDLFVYGSVEFE
eukprot:PhM_4_TR17386/c0_g3_i4/m.32784